jgi:hypothetical protein
MVQVGRPESRIVSFRDRANPQEYLQTKKPAILPVEWRAVSEHLGSWGLLAEFEKEGESDSAGVDVNDVLIGVSVIHVQVPVADTYSPLRLYLIVEYSRNLVIHVSAPTAC